MAITLNAKNIIQTSMKGVHKIQEELTIQDFIDLHSGFIRDKRLENLAQWTIEDHIYLFSFFTRWITKSHQFNENHYVACTVNVRIDLISSVVVNSVL